MDGAIIAMTMMTNVKIVVAEDAVVVNEEEDLWTCLDGEKAFFFSK